MRSLPGTLFQLIIIVGAAVLFPADGIQIFLPGRAYVVTL